MKKQAITSMALCIVAFAISAMYPSYFDGGSLSASDSMHYSNPIKVEVCWSPNSEFNPIKDGEVHCQETWTENTITNVGLNHTAYVWSGILGSGGLNVTYMELSTDSGAPSIDDAACPSPVTGNGLDIDSAPATMIGIGNYSLTHKWTASGTQAGIAKICLSNDSASAGALMASALLTPATGLGSGDNLSITYYVAVS